MTTRLISFRGRIGSGKSYAADYLCRTYGFKRVAFADPVKDVCKLVTPDGIIDKARDRALMQFIGTEYYRAMDVNHWVNKWKDRVWELLGAGVSVVVDDARFPNERKAVKELNGTDVWVQRPEADRLDYLAERDGNVSHGIPGHSSEQFADPDFETDFTVTNVENHLVDFIDSFVNL